MTTPYYGSDLDEYAFNEWMRNVDAELAAKLGAVSDDLPDQCYRDYFDSGMSPGDAVEEVLADIEEL